MDRYEQLMQGLLHGGFLTVVIAWHELVQNKAVILSASNLMILAAVLWSVAAIAYMFKNCSRILQQEVHGWPPWYYYLLVVPFCIYASLTPWALLQMLGAIRPPIA